MFGVRVSSEGFTIIGSVLMIGTTIYGFRAIDRLSRFAVPLLSALIIYALWTLLAETGAQTLLQREARPTENLSSVAGAISVVIGSIMVGVTLVPDLARFLRARRDAIAGSVLSYGFGLPMVLFLAGLPVLVAVDPDLIQVMTSLGLGIPALIVMIFATWTTNINNLYSASLSIAKIVPKVRDWMITLFAGVIGTVVALAGIMEHFIDFLILLGVVVPPIAGIYLADFFLIRPSRIHTSQEDPIQEYRFAALFAWIVASAFGLMAINFGWRLIGVPAVDTLLVAAFVLTFWERVSTVASARSAQTRSTGG